ncbi:hypothetical protein JOC76_004892 [Neobacillus cucumis]|nr:hypothetical protein [Neobacillus cucumis]
MTRKTRGSTSTGPGVIIVRAGVYSSEKTISSISL